MSQVNIKGEDHASRSDGIGACLAATRLSAGSADVSVAEPAPQPPVVVADPAPDRTGFYAGLQVENLDGTSNAGPIESEFDGTLFGVHAGYRHDFGRFVLGGEVDDLRGDGDASAPPVPGARFPGANFSTDHEHLWRVGVEAGVDMGPALVCGTAGFADIEISGGGGTVSSRGYVYGLGADFLVTDHVTLGVEVLQHEFDDFDGAAPAPDDAEALTIGLNASFRF